MLIELTSCAVDLIRRRVVRPAHGGSRPDELTTREADLLGYLARRPSTPVTRGELLAEAEALAGRHALGREGSETGLLLGALRGVALP